MIPTHTKTSYNLEVIGGLAHTDRISLAIYSNSMIISKYISNVCGSSKDFAFYDL